jgi:hypothetical protein
LNAATYLDIKNKVGTYKVCAKPQTSYSKNGFDFLNITDNFAIEYFDKSKRSANYTNYANGGFFANYSDAQKNYFTLPVANLKCNIREIPKGAEKYLRPFISNGVLTYNCNNNQSNQFHNKQVATLIVPYQGNPYIIDTNTIPENAKFAVSCVPTVRHGDDVDYYNYVKKQGWDESCMYGTYRHWLGVRDG